MAARSLSPEGDCIEVEQIAVGSGEVVDAARVELNKPVLAELLQRRGFRDSALRDTVSSLMQEMHEHDSFVNDAVATISNEIPDDDEKHAVASFAAEVDSFADVRHKRSAITAERDASRRAFAQEKADVEERRAAILEENRTVADNRRTTRHQTLTEHTQDILNQQNRQAAKRVQYSSRLQTQSVRQEHSWEALVAQLEGKRRARLAEIATKNEVEAVGLVRGAAAASDELLALRLRYKRLQRQCEETHSAADRKEYVVASRRSLVEGDTATALRSCDAMIRRAADARRTIASPISPSPQRHIPDPCPVPPLPSTPSLDTSGLTLSVTYSNGRPLVQNGSLLPAITARILLSESTNQAVLNTPDIAGVLAEATEGVPVVLSAVSPGVCLTGVVTAPLKGLECVFDDVVITAAPGAEVTLAVTAALYPPRTQEVNIAVRQDHNVTIGPMYITFAGTLPRWAWVDGIRYVVPPSGRITRRGLRLRCTEPLMQCAVSDGYSGAGGTSVWEDVLVDTQRSRAVGDLTAMCLLGKTLLAHADRRWVCIEGSDAVCAVLDGAGIGVTAVQLTRTTAVVSGYDATHEHRVLASFNSAPFAPIPVPSARYLAVTEAGWVVVATNTSILVWSGPPLSPECVIELKSPCRCLVAQGEHVIVCDERGHVLVWKAPRVVCDMDEGALCVAALQHNAQNVTVVAKRGGRLRLFEEGFSKAADLGVHPSSLDVAALRGVEHNADAGIVVSACTEHVAVWDITTKTLMKRIAVDWAITNDLFAVYLRSRESHFNLHLSICIGSEGAVHTVDVTSVDLLARENGSPSQRDSVSPAGSALLSPAVEWTQQECDHLSDAIICGTTPAARWMGFIKANTLPPPSPCTESAMRQAIIEHITFCKLSGQLYVDWWSPKPPPETNDLS